MRMMVRKQLQEVNVDLGIFSVRFGGRIVFEKESKESDMTGEGFEVVDAFGVDAVCPVIPSNVRSGSGGNPSSVKKLLPW